MKLLITGGTGFIGQAVCTFLHQQGHTLCVLTRNKAQAKKRLPLENIYFISSLSEIEPDKEFNCVINLAGAPIVKRWSARTKKEIKDSRINLTNQLIELFKTLKKKPKVLISGSAIGYYGPNNDQKGFSHELCQAWENAALKAEHLGIRVCLIRTGLVLGPNGGIIGRMRLPFLLGLGGMIGSGDQWMSWVHLEDMVRIINFCIESNNIEGPLNATAPHPVTNQEFTKIYGKVLHRPTLFTMPAWFIKLAFGEMGKELLLAGPQIFPHELIKMSFDFKHPELEGALLNIK